MSARHIDGSGRRRLAARWWSGVAAVWLIGCAQDVGLIDRVQPGALRKSTLQGEWFYARTVVDVPYHVGYTFVGETEELDRVRFEIREDQLIAYRSYDFVAGTDLDHAAARQPGQQVHGTPVGAWKISKHFDITRSYNAATGEQTNVLEENAQDRPWYEREWIRVDWSNNLLTSFLFTVDGVDTAPANAAMTHPADPDALTLAWRQGAGWAETRDPVAMREVEHVAYLDFVVKVAAKPVAWDFWDPDWGPERYPACWFFLNEDCKPAEIAVRTAFLRVDPAEDADYLPLAYPDNVVARDAAGNALHVVEHAEILDDGDEEATVSLGLTQDPDGYQVRIPYFDRFGYFRTERYGYDPKHGEVDSARQQQINRYAIWQRYRDDQGKPLPYGARTPKPIVYYLTPGFPAALKSAAQQAIAGWDLAFRKAVGARLGKAPEAVPTMVELRDNTLRLESGVIVDRGQRIGDLRYSLLSFIDEPTRAGLLGYGPAWADPVSGRVIAAAAHNYGGPLRRFATTGRDLVRLVRGELDPEEYGLGRQVADEVVASLLGSKHPSAQASGSAGLPGSHGKPSGKGGSGGKGASAAGGGAKAWPAAQPQGDAARAQAKEFAAAHVTPAGKKALAAARKTTLRDTGAWAQQRLDKAAGTDAEAALLSRELALAFGDPALQAKLSQAKAGAGVPLPPLDADARARLSPRRWAGLHNRLRALDRERLLHRHCMMHEDLVDDGVLGIAKELQDLPPEEAWNRIYAAVFRSTAEHELGHTFGLRHNFEASTDALNWHGGYWKLRGEAGKPLEEPTKAQLEAGMNDLRYSSIMEYAGRFHADMRGLGRYDEAAIAFGYTELVEVWGDQARSGLEKHGMFRALHEESRYLAGGDPSLAAPDRVLDAALRGFIHYTAVPKIVGGVANLDDRKLVPMEDVVAEMTALGSSDAAKRKRTLWPVPYRFCSDEYEMATKTCHVYDDGADPWEIVASGMDRWRSHYVLDAFRRDRVDFFLDEYAWQAWFRYLHPVVIQYQHWLFDQWDPEDFFNPGVMWDWLATYRPTRAGIATTEAYWEQAAQGGLPATQAVRSGISWLTSVIATPEPGSYCLDKSKNEFQWLSFNTAVDVCKAPAGCEAGAACADLVVPFGVGRYGWTEYDGDTGYTFYERVRHAGSFYDKEMALEVLADPTTYFIGVDGSQPINNYILGTFLVFPKEITSIFGGLAADRSDVIGWKVHKDGTLREPDPFADPANHAGLPSIEIAGSYTLRPFAMFYGLAWLNAAWDQSFGDALKVWLDGSGEALALPAAATVATFASPLNHRTYKAVKSPRDGWFSAGYEMVLRTAALGQAWQADPSDVSARWALEDETSFLELARGMYAVFGTPWF